MKSKKIIPAIAIAFCLAVQNANAQAPSIQWQECVGGTGNEIIYYVIKLSDGNYLSCGSTNSIFGTDHQDIDAFLVKTNGKGDIIWKEKYGGSHDEIFYNIIETPSGDIIAIGTTKSNDGQVHGHHGMPDTDDVWLVKTDKNGILKKQKCFGGTKSEGTPDWGECEGLIMTKDGSILFTAETASKDGDVKKNNGDYDGWVVKLKPESTPDASASSWVIDWETVVGDANYDAAYNIHEIADGFLITGTNATIKYNETNLEEFFKAFAAKLDKNGHQVWYRMYGGTGSDDCNASLVTSDGNLMLAGHAASTDGDCVGNSGFKVWIWKIKSSNGDFIWKRFVGAPTDTSAAFNITATHDGGFVAMGVTGHYLEGTADAYVLKLNASGDTLWTKRFGGSGLDFIQGGVEENDQSIFLGGTTSSNDGVVSGNHGGEGDAWLVNLGNNPMPAGAIHQTTSSHSSTPHHMRGFPKKK